MSLSDALDPERAFAALVRFTVYLILLCVFVQFIACRLRQISPIAEFATLCLLCLVSPLAYLIRRKRQGGRQRLGPRRGAERTPLLPPNQEVV
jgi:hypothetical protein